MTITDSEKKTKDFLDILKDKKNHEAFTDLVKKVTELHQTGGLDTLFELISLVHAMKSAATDNIVERLFSAAERTTDVLSDEETLKLIEDTRESLRLAASKKTKGNSGGMIAILKLLSETDSYRSLDFLLTFSKELEKRARAR
mgnify:CR=1 FL=1